MVFLDQCFLRALGCRGSRRWLHMALGWSEREKRRGHAEKQEKRRLIELLQGPALPLAPNGVAQAERGAAAPTQGQKNSRWNLSMEE